jgi:hypothetical protein
MININTIIETLVPNYKHSTVNNSNNNSLNISKYDYDIGENYQSFIKCFLKAFDKYNDFILIFLQLTNINKNINRKKLINIIKHNIINNEVILLISGIFECNIWIYYEENNMFKVYYLEESFNKNKQNVVISFGKIKDSIEYGYQMCYNGDVKMMLFDYNHQIIQSFISNYLIIPIGLEENKKLVYNNNENNPLLENLDQILINDNFIFKSLNLVKE